MDSVAQMAKERVAKYRRGQFIADTETGLRRGLEQQRIPTHMHESLVAYVMDGQVTGGFLEAVLTNNLAETFVTADDENVLAVRGYVAVLYNDVPAACWGTQEKYDQWCQDGGLRGRELDTVLQSEPAADSVEVDHD